MKKLFLIFLVFFISCQIFSQTKKVHFSIDDVSTVFKEISEREEDYNSIFEHDFFYYVKTLHEKYNCIITLYCFYELNDFSLNQATRKFAKDFRENSSWLKIGYHAYSQNKTFDNTGGGYDLFVKEIERICGSKKNISQTVRLDYFKGSEEALIANSYKNKDFGIKQLLTADSKTRKSYFLDDEYIKLITKAEKLTIDVFDFFATDFRFDDYKNYKTLFEENNGEDEIIVFTHEWLLHIPLRKNLIQFVISKYKEFKIKQNIDSFMKYAKQNKYIFVSQF